MSETKIPSPFPLPLVSGPVYSNPENAKQAVPDGKSSMDKAQQPHRKKTATATYVATKEHPPS